MIVPIHKNKMTVEHIGLSRSQFIYGKKNLLYSQMELLTIVKRYQEYKKFRKQELALKKLLGEKANEVHAEIENFSLTLPKTKQEVFKPVEIRKSQKKRKDLEFEIEEIRSKIAQLR